uniref:Small ribosomal subunit protein uS15 N-terminal domain-containing protein n=1 Tax=Urocitellus parryii TaxID=9999 RepID=A0A8D2GSF0_UROPR
MVGCILVPRKDLCLSALSSHHIIPTWLKLTSEDTKEHIYKPAEVGLTPSQIWVC